MRQIPKERFRLAQRPPEAELTQPQRHGSDVFRRFRRNPSSVAAALVLLVLLLFALLTPLFSPYDVQFRDAHYKNLLPKCSPLSFLGWDGQKRISGSQGALDYYSGIGVEFGESAVKKIQSSTDQQTGKHYTMQVDTYDMVGFVYLDVSRQTYEDLRSYEERTGYQVRYPLPRYFRTTFLAYPGGANLWYVLQDSSPASTGESAYHDLQGQPIFVPDYLLDDRGQPVYAVENQTGYRIRVLYRQYYHYVHGFYPNHLFGTDQHGQDILVNLASGARLSFLLALSVSVINFAIGILYGAVEGYYGGKVDLAMERVADILSAVPFIVVATLFQLHLAQRAGAVLSLLFAFVATGWIGIASRVRAQFYRFKGAEYVLAARTLGAGDGRLILRHILPNALGTVITGTILLIPGVIFSESMLSYLGIVNLEASGFTSIGTMLAGGRAYLGTYPHILLFPAVLIALLEISFNLLGNGLRDALNPHLRKD